MMRWKACKAAVEAEIPDQYKGMIGEICAAFQVRPENWMEIPGLRKVFQHYAASKIASQLISDGMPQEKAIQEAAMGVGLDGRSFSQNVTRWGGIPPRGDRHSIEEGDLNSPD